MQSGVWRDNEKRAPDALDFGEIRQEGYRLDGFAETHLVCLWRGIHRLRGSTALHQNAVDALLVEIDQPIQALQLQE